jgi:hypothetical protein
MTYLDELTSGIADLLDEVLQLRLEVSLPSSQAIPQIVLDSLLDARAKSDRVEEISIKILRRRSKVLRYVAVLKASVDDKWSTAIVDMKKSSARNRDQYEGPRERYAEADLAVLDSRRKLRQAEEVLALLDEASDVIKVAFRGINDILQDHRTWLRTFQIQPYNDK